jgi:hypothetical protein
MKLKYMSCVEVRSSSLDVNVIIFPRLPPRDQEEREKEEKIRAWKMHVPSCGAMVSDE